MHYCPKCRREMRFACPQAIQGSRPGHVETFRCDPCGVTLRVEMTFEYDKLSES